MRPPQAKRIWQESRSVLFRLLLPFLLTGAVYDSLRYFESNVREEVQVAEPYDFDKAFFGIKTADGVLTPNEWWQLHTHPVLDLITGFFYLGFIAIFVALSAYFVIYRSRTGNHRFKAAEIARRSPRMPWSFLLLNMIGYATYYFYPAAPPWYAAKFGFGPADLSAAPDPAGCARFDELLGVTVFSDMYSKSLNIFGAVPSLHVAYPLLAVYFTFVFGELRLIALIYYFMMCFSAVYLNHHYILDIIWGSVYALLVPILLERALDAWRVSRLARLIRFSHLQKNSSLFFQFTRSQLSSSIATCTDFIVTLAITEWVGAWYMVGSSIGAFSGAVTHFMLSRYFSFRAFHGRIQAQATRYLLIAGASLVLNSLLVYVLTEFSDIPYLWSKAVAGLAVGWGFNFPLHRQFVFKGRQRS